MLRGRFGDACKPSFVLGTGGFCPALLVGISRDDTFVYHICQVSQYLVAQSF